MTDIRYEMKRIAFFFCVIVLLICICVALFLGWQFVLTRAFMGDADLSWVNDCLDDFIARKNRLPTNWEEIHELVMEHGLYPSIPGIEDRVALNFSVFSILNQNTWQVEMIDDKDQWVYYFRYEKKPTKQQDRLKKYCETLAKMEQATKLKE